MPYTESRVGRDGRRYYRARYKLPTGGTGTVLGSDGKAIRYPSARAALRAAREAEQAADVAASRGRWVPPEVARTTFGEYAQRWYEAQDLAASTMQSYAHYLKHLLPEFGELPIGDIDTRAIEAWERAEREAGVAATSLRTYRAVLHLILADAVEEGLRPSNPAARRRGRGKRAGRSATRGPEKSITDMLGALLLAERAALLTGRDDEFVACVLISATGMRWGEVVGLEPQYVRGETIRIEQQLYELDTGGLVLCPPKDDSYRTLDSPAWLTRLLRDHLSRTEPQPCACHSKPFAFSGRGGQRGEGPTLTEVARQARVSTGTVSNVLNHPDRVRPDKRAAVEQAIADLGYVRQGGPAGDAAHWRRSGFAAWVFTPAATGWYPAKAPQPRRPVPVLAEPWPGVPARGRGAAGRATASWAPIRHGLTRHGLRHMHRTLMEQWGTPKVLMDERMGHIDGSVSARYAHVTEEMRLRLREALTVAWEAALDARLALGPSSPVPVLDRLLRERTATLQDPLPGDSPERQVAALSAL